MFQIVSPETLGTVCWRLKTTGHLVAYCGEGSRNKAFWPKNSSRRALKNLWREMRRYAEMRARGSFNGEPGPEYIVFKLACELEFEEFEKYFDCVSVAELME